MLKVFTHQGINNKNLNFSNFFKSDECASDLIQGGRMQPFVHNNEEGILWTTADNNKDVFNKKAQDDKSIFNKIILIIRF